MLGLGVSEGEEGMKQGQDIMTQRLCLLKENMVNHVHVTLFFLSNIKNKIKRPGRKKDDGKCVPFLARHPKTFFVIFDGVAFEISAKVLFIIHSFIFRGKFTYSSAAAALVVSHPAKKRTCFYYIHSI